MIRFKAALLKKCTADRPFSESRPLQVCEIDAQDPADNEVLVRIRAASLCRSDLSVITGVRAWPMPIVPGHEASGIVDRVGRNVSRFSPGDQVVLVYQAHCGVCPCCAAGKTYLCEPGLAANRAGALLGGGPRLSINGEPVHHHMGLSAFAEMALVSEHSLVKVDADLDADIAALFGCAIMCGAGSVINTGAVAPGETVAIAGIGGVGASAILGAKMAGAERIIAIDPDPGKRRAALELGATDAIEADADAANQVTELTRGGVDCALESAGVVEAFDIAYHAARRGGRVVSVGLVSPKTPFSLDIASLVTQAKTVIGSYMGSCDAARDIPRFIAHFKRGELPVDRLITHRLGLSDINLALERMAASQAFRQIITP